MWELFLAHPVYFGVIIFFSFFVVVKDEYKSREFRYEGNTAGDRILKAKIVRKTEIHRQSAESYDERTMKEKNASKWCLLFKGGGNNLHDWE